MRMAAHKCGCVIDLIHGACCWNWVDAAKKTCIFMKPEKKNSEQANVGKTWRILSCRPAKMYNGRKIGLKNSNIQTHTNKHTHYSSTLIHTFAHHVYAHCDIELYYWILWITARDKSWTCTLNWQKCSSFFQPVSHFKFLLIQLHIWLYDRDLIDHLNWNE